jgi:hypothetical protein
MARRRVAPRKRLRGETHPPARSGDRGGNLQWLPFFEKLPDDGAELHVKRCLPALHHHQIETETLFFERAPHQEHSAKLSTRIIKRRPSMAAILSAKNIG